MIKIADITSLLEIGFAVNAVFVFVFSNYRRTNDKLYLYFIEQASKHRDIGCLSKKHIESFLYKAARPFRILKRSFYVVASLSLVMVIWSIIWLIIYAFSPDYEISKFSFVLYVIFSIFLSPILYFCFSEGGRYLIKITKNNVVLSRHDTDLLIISSDISERFEEFSKRFNEKYVKYKQGVYKRKFVRFFRAMNKYLNNLKRRFTRTR